MIKQAITPNILGNGENFANLNSVNVFIGSSTAFFKNPDLFEDQDSSTAQKMQ